MTVFLPVLESARKSSLAGQEPFTARLPKLLDATAPWLELARSAGLVTQCQAVLGYLNSAQKPFPPQRLCPFACARGCPVGGGGGQACNALARWDDVRARLI
jgi:hypothetical protein